uniref:PRELI domain containing 1a n=1 Tax=Erpetoichthys calabaricus TaxID=27687 RepID=A0A8C4TEH1_ERPCA
LNKICYKLRRQAFQRHVLTEDVIHREVTPENKLITRRLLTKTNRLPRWAEKIFPSNLSRSVFIIEDSIVDPKSKTFTTFTWNINHRRLMVRKMFFGMNSETHAWTRVQREAWISFCGIRDYFFFVMIQEFGLARFKSNQAKAMKGLEYTLANLQGIEGPSRTLKDTAKEATEKAKETALAATEKAKNLATAAAPQKSSHFV